MKHATIAARDGNTQETVNSRKDKSEEMFKNEQMLTGEQ